MRKRIITRMLCLLGVLLAETGAYAQSEDDQLLIFRNTGETNLLYQSKVDSITLTKIDTLGVEHEEPIAQLFHTTDTVLYVPIAEIDSVCFGPRNAIEYRSDVRVLRETLDMQWIIRYDGSKIYYKVETPNDILPTVGTKLYFPEQTELFPYGLCAKVDDVVRGGEEVAVSVSAIDYTEVFRKFFYAGSVDGVKPAHGNAHRAEELDKGETIKSSINIGDDDELSVDGRIGIHGDVVLNPLSLYYHAMIEIENVLGFSIKAKSEESTEYNFEHNFLHIPLPTVAGIFLPSVDVGLFVDMNAELAFEYAMDRKATTRIEWTRQDGTQKFTRSNPTENGAQGNTAKTQITLNGSIYAGLQTVFNFDMIGDVIGASAKVKYGTDFNGELSMGALADLSRTYDVTAYGRAELALQSKVKFEGNVKHRANWVWGEVEETTIMEYEHVICERKIDLFPRFFAPRVIATPARDNVSASIKSKNEIAHEVETGFQILESKENPIPVDSIFVKDIEVKPDGDVQGVAAEMEIPKSIASADSVVLRPVFHYAGYTIPHDMLTAMTDPNIQPVIVSMANGGCTLVSGTPLSDNVTIDSTLYIIGPNISIPYNDTVFHDVSPYAGIGEEYLYYEDAQNLEGTWIGQIDEETITITFTSDNTCVYKCDDISMTNATYCVNEPQSGYLLIESSDASIVFDVQSISENEMTVRFKNSMHKGKVCKLGKSGL